MRTILQHIRGNVVAYLALFVALGGTSYAAVNLPANSVTSRQIKNGSVTRADLAASARPLTRARMAEAITQVVTDPATGIDVTLHAQDGAQGPQGDPGPQGPAGPAGQDAVVHLPVITARAQSVNVAQGSTFDTTSACKDGETVIGGGATTDAPQASLYLTTFVSGPAGNGWRIQGQNRDTNNPHTFLITAYCAQASS